MIMLGTLLPLTIVLFIHITPPECFAENFLEVPIVKEMEFAYQEIIRIKLPTIYQCSAYCAVFKLCRSISFNKEQGRCLLNSEGNDRQNMWRKWKKYKNLSLAKILQELGGACRGHSCAIGELCVEAGPTHICVPHEYSTVKCQESWGRHGDLCFNVYKDLQNWMGANESCASYGGELVNMESEDDYLFHRNWIQFRLRKMIKGATRGQIWTAVSFTPPLPAWINITGTSSGGDDLCLAMDYMHSGYENDTLTIYDWKVVSCNEKHGFACVVRAPDRWP